MKRAQMMPIASIIALFFILGLPATAQAYLDPGTGSFVIQMLIAGVLGALLWIKLAWTRLKLFFHNLFNGRKLQEQEKELNDNE